MLEGQGAMGELGLAGTNQMMNRNVGFSLADAASIPPKEANYSHRLHVDSPRFRLSSSNSEGAA